MPRHPPCALDNLTNTHIKKSRHNKTLQKQKMLASTVQFSTTTRTTNPPTTPAAGRSNDRTKTTTTGPHSAGTGGRPLRTQQCVLNPPARRNESGGSMRSVFPHFLEQPLHAGHPTPRLTSGWEREAFGALHHPHRCTEQSPVDTGIRWCSVKLLRKEVIQPHLPVRLPCYDFVPIASPTFDRSPPCGLGHGLRVLPTFVT